MDKLDMYTEGDNLAIYTAVHRRSTREFMFHKTIFQFLSRIFYSVTVTIPDDDLVQASVDDD